MTRSRILAPFALVALTLTMGCRAADPEPGVTAPTAVAGTATNAPPPPPSDTTPPKPVDRAALADPSRATEQAPAEFNVRFQTTKGDFVVRFHREWSPNGVDRIYNLARAGFYDGTRFFRVVSGFMVQFGINGDPAVSGAWREAGIKDDPVRASNTRGKVTFAQSGAPNSRTTQIFINFGDNSRLDAMRFAPIGEVTAGMDVVDHLYSGYGEGAPSGNGPDQARLQHEGNAYLDADFPRLDTIKAARIE